MGAHSISSSDSDDEDIERKIPLLHKNGNEENLYKSRPTKIGNQNSTNRPGEKKAPQTSKLETFL